MKHGRRLGGLAIVLGALCSTVGARADVNDDCIAANASSIALRRSGKLVEARAEASKCALASCGEDVQGSCLKRVEDLTAALPSIVFDVKDASGADLAGVKITIDGKRVESAGSLATTLDPGQHVFLFEVAGQPSLQKTFVLREGDHGRRETISFPAATPAPVTPPPVEPATSVTGDEATSPGSAQRILGLSLGGLGVVGLAIGGVFGLSASSKWSDAKQQCGAGCTSNSAAQGSRDDASSAAAVSTISFVAGGVLLAGGAALFFTAPSSSGAAASSPAGSLRLSPSTGPRGTGLSLTGAF